LGVLVKNSLNLVSFLPTPPNFRRNENMRFKGIERNDVPFYPFHFIHLNSQIKE